ncbi:MAG: ribosome-associated translation inhibitor RaiA [bacterium]
MLINIRGKNIQLTDSLRTYTESKVGKLQKFYEDLSSADVSLIVEKNRNVDETHKVEITLHANGTIIRGEESTISMYSSIDVAVDKLERQLKKYKQKLYKNLSKDKRREQELSQLPQLPNIDLPLDITENLEPRIVRSKQFAMKPMDPEEAALQMELLGHDFHVFLNPDTNQINVVYKRKDGNYGLIEPTHQ